MNELRRVVADSFAYSIAMVIASAATGVQTMLIARWLSPGTYGVWTLLMVILGYNAHAHFGLIHGMTRLLPYARARGEAAARVMGIQNAIFTAVLALAFLVSAALIGTAMVWQAGPFAGPLVALAMLTPAHQLHTFMTSALRVYGKLGLVSLTTAFLPVGSLLLTVGVLRLLDGGLVGLLWALTVSHLSMCTFIWGSSGLKLRIHFDLAAVVDGFREGTPVLISGILLAIFLSIDRWAIAQISLESVGHYGIAAMAGGFSFGLAAVVPYVLYPRMLEAFGVTRQAASLSGLVYRPLLAVAWLSALAGCVIVLIGPVFVRHLLPSYTPTLEVIGIIMLAYYFLSLSTVPANFLTAIGYERRLIVMQVGGILVLTCAAYIVVRSTGSVFAVATLVALIYALYAIGAVFLSLRALGNGLGKSLQWAVGLAVFGVLAFGLVQGIALLGEKPGTGLWDEAALLVIHAALFLVGLLVLSMVSWKVLDLPIGQARGGRAIDRA